MIDPVKDELIDFKQAAKLPPFRRGSKACHVGRIHSYATRGLKGSDGEWVKLEAVRVPSGWRTTRTAVAAFIHALTFGNATGPAADSTREHERAERELSAAGI